MTNELNLLIEKSCKEIVTSDEIKQKIKSAKNYVANKNLDKWAFSKLIATTNFKIKHGSEAKPYFYNLGFINILSIKDEQYKNLVTKSFLEWARTVNYFDISKKFKDDQHNLKRFELLVHIDEIPKKIINSENLLEDNLREFIEGFKTEITTEIINRSNSLIKYAKAKLENPSCIICGFNFEKTYGLHGKGFIEMHHTLPISNGKRVSRVEDLETVCSNCHRMLHKGKLILTKEEIREMIKKNRASS